MILNNTKCLFLFVVPIIVIITIGCDSDSSEGSTSPKEIMNKSVNAMDALESYRQTSFKLRIDDEHTDWKSVPKEEWILTDDSSWVSPDKDHIIWINDNGWHEHIVIGNEQWWRGESSSYSQLSWISSSESGSSVAGWTVQQIEEGFQGYATYDEIELIGSEVINGVDCFHLHCTDEANKVPDIDEIIAEFWISKNDFLFRQIVGTFLPQSTSSDYIESFIVQWGDFNQPIEIEPPPTDHFEPSDLPFPEGTFFNGSSDHSDLPYLAAPGSSTDLNEGQYYTLFDSMDITDEQKDLLYERIYAKQAESLSAGSSPDASVPVHSGS